jgi:signal-transduction protein with cAMP-binding, CBS, and nucleotidyltransferase domain
LAAVGTIGPIAAVTRGALNDGMTTQVLDATSPIGRLVVRDPVRVDDAATLAEAATVMRQNDVSSVLVGTHGAIATERDLTRAIAAGLSTDESIGTVASVDPVRIGALIPLVDAAALMLNDEIRHLIVEFPDGHDGVVSLRDIVAVLVQTARPELWLTSLRIAVQPPTDLWLG